MKRVLYRDISGMIDWKELTRLTVFFCLSSLFELQRNVSERYFYANE